MKLLLDTQLVLWAAYMPECLSPAARAMIEDFGNELVFSPASMWEVVIKRALTPDGGTGGGSSDRRGLVGGRLG